MSAAPGVSICTIPILGLKFDSKLASIDHVCGIVSCVLVNWYFEDEMCICGHLFVILLLLCICFPNPWVLFSSVGVSFWMSCPAALGFALIRVFAVVSLTSCCGVYTWKLYKVNSNFNHCSVSFFLQFCNRVQHTWAAAIRVWSSYQGVERPNFQGVSC